MTENQTVWLAAYCAALSGLLVGVDRPDMVNLEHRARVAANHAVAAFKEVNP